MKVNVYLKHFLDNVRIEILLNFSRLFIRCVAMRKGKCSFLIDIFVFNKGTEYIYCNEFLSMEKRRILINFIYMKLSF